jgi:hypothetical protein
MGNNGSYVMSTLPLSRGNIKHESALRSGVFGILERVVDVTEEQPAQENATAADA